MAYPFDNRFTGDSIPGRLARLQAIESNHVQILSLLPLLHPSVVAWAPHCHTQYRALVDSAGVSDGNTLSGTTNVHLATDTLHLELLYAKEYILSHYDEDRVRLDAFDIEGELPSETDDMLSLAHRIKSVTALHKAEEIDYCINDAQMLRINNAAAAILTATGKRIDGISGADTSHSAENQRFLSDISKLRRLLASWHGSFGGDDPRIGIIGMVNTHRGGNSGRPGAPGLQLSVTANSLEIIPNSTRPAATSYLTLFRATDDSQDWEEYANNAETHIPLIPTRFQPDTQYEFHTRARNANGFSDWSVSVIVNAP